MGKPLLLTSSDVCPALERLKYNYRSCRKVMFSQACVILSTGGIWCHFLSRCLVPCSFCGCMMSLLVWLSVTMFFPGGRGLSPEGVLPQRGSRSSVGVTIQGDLISLQRDPLTPLGLISSSNHQSGQYVSYWNAFLFPLILWALYGVITYVWRFM